MNSKYFTSICAALHAGKEIMSVYNGSDFNVEFKADNSPLTLADKLAHLKIVEYLEPTGIPILSEEGKHLPHAERKTWTQFWLVDPLDGTKEFVKRNGEFTVNIALIEGGNPVFGVILVPVTSELYFGGTELGSYKITNTQSSDYERLDDLISASKKLPFQKTERPFTAVGSRSHLSSETQDVFDMLKDKHGDFDVISKGSSLKFCMIAEGIADIYPRLGPTMEWDTAAGHAIALGSGARTYRHDNGAPLTYNKENLLNPFFIVERN